MELNLPDIELAVEQSYCAAGIQVTPIILKQQQNPPVQRFLWEGLEDHSVEIKERQSSSVPMVTLINHKQEKFLGHKGSVIRGGGQNRQLVHTVVVPEGATMEIPVQCIQHGRWNPYQNREFTSKRGETTSPSLRFYAKNQSETWHTISETSTMSGTVSITADYTTTSDFLVGSHEEMHQSTQSIRFQDKGSQEKRTHSRDRAQKMIDDCKNIPGQVGLYVVMVDPLRWKEGKVSALSCIEIFGSPELYQKTHRDIVASFALDAVLLPDDENSSNLYRKELGEKVDKEKFAKFVESIHKASWQEAKSIGHEQRQETTSRHFFGETVSLGKDILHLMYSSYAEPREQEVPIA